MRRAFRLVVLVWLTSTTAVSHAQGEHGRRAAAELRVLAGDVAKLAEYESANIESLLQKGLKDRISGSLSALDLLLRLADQESDRTPVYYAAQIQYAFDYADAGQWTRLANLLAALEDKFPLMQPVFPGADALLDSSRELHQGFCAGCHDIPIQGVERPAYNLFEQAAILSDSEFFARMLVGVRGDRVTGIDNPFTDTALAGLIYFYRSGAPD